MSYRPNLTTIDFLSKIDPQHQTISLNKNKDFIPKKRSLFLGFIRWIFHVVTCRTPRNQILNNFTLHVLKELNESTLKQLDEDITLKEKKKFEKSINTLLKLIQKEGGNYRKEINQLLMTIKKIQTLDPAKKLIIPSEKKEEVRIEKIQDIESSKKNLAVNSSSKIEKNKESQITKNQISPLSKASPESEEKKQNSFKSLKTLDIESNITSSQENNLATAKQGILFDWNHLPDDASKYELISKILGEKDEESRKKYAQFLEECIDLPNDVWQKVFYFFNKDGLTEIQQYLVMFDEKQLERLSLKDEPFLQLFLTIRNNRIYLRNGLNFKSMAVWISLNKQEQLDFIKFLLKYCFSSFLDPVQKATWKGFYSFFLNYINYNNEPIFSRTIDDFCRENYNNFTKEFLNELATHCYSLFNFMAIIMLKASSSLTVDKRAENPSLDLNILRLLQPLDIKILIANHLNILIEIRSRFQQKNKEFLEFILNHLIEGEKLHSFLKDAFLSDKLDDEVLEIYMHHLEIHPWKLTLLLEFDPSINRKELREWIAKANQILDERRMKFIEKHSSHLNREFSNRLQKGNKRFGHTRNILKVCLKPD